MCIVATYKKKGTHFDVSVYLLDEKYYVIIEQLASVSNEWMIRWWDIILCWFYVGPFVKKRWWHLFVWPYYFWFWHEQVFLCFLSPSSVSNVPLVCQFPFCLFVCLLLMWCDVIWYARQRSFLLKEECTLIAVCGVTEDGKAGRIGWKEICLCKAQIHGLPFANGVWTLTV